MSGFPERVAEALVKSLSQNDLEEFYTYVKYLQIALTTLYFPVSCCLGGIIGYTVKRRKVLLRKWGRLQVFLVNLSVFIFLWIPIYSTVRAMSNLNSVAISMHKSLSSCVLSLEQLSIFQFSIGLTQVLLLSIFMSKYIELSKKWVNFY
jgi:hypothetical protein